MESWTDFHYMFVPGPTGCKKQKYNWSVVFRRLLFLFPFLILGLARLHSVCFGPIFKNSSVLFMIYFSKWFFRWPVNKFSLCINNFWTKQKIVGVSHPPASP